jgi:hypothetical protein
VKFWEWRDAWGGLLALDRTLSFSPIAHKFERLRAQQREAQRQAEHLFQTLLHRAFRGEL